MKHGTFEEEARIGGLYRVHHSILEYLEAVAYNVKYSKVHTRVLQPVCAHGLL